MLKLRASLLGLAACAPAIGLASSIALLASASHAAAPLDDRIVSLAAEKFEADAYRVEMKGTGTYRSGSEAAATLTLSAKSGYHVNDKYPIKLKLSDPAPEGVSYPKAVLKRDDATCSESSCSFRVPFVPTRAGQAKITGIFSFSVCSESSCLLEKLELELTVDVQ